MNIAVLVKRVPDPEARIEVLEGALEVEEKHVMGFFDEIALEKALRIKEAMGGAVTVITVGLPPSDETVRKGIAMGADRAILVMTDEEVEPLAVAKILAKIVEEEAPKLVICGKQAIDDDSNQTGQMLAALLGWGQGTFANEVAIEGDSITVKREIDGGLQTVKLGLPAVVTTDLRLNEPRYASLPNIMKAKKKPFEEKTPADYGVDITPRLTTTNVVEPPVRQAGEIVADVDALVEKLKAVGAI